MLLALLALPGCGSVTGLPDPPQSLRFLGHGLALPAGRAAPSELGVAAQTSSPVAPYVGLGRDGSNVSVAGAKPIVVEPGGKAMSLQFENTDIQDFVRSVFDELLHEPVIIDPRVAGKVTIRTGEPVDRAGAIDIVRQMLAMNGAGLDRDGKVWRVSQRAPGQAGAAANARIVILHNLDGDQAKAALQGFAGGSVTIAAIPASRTLILAGRDEDLAPLLELLATLDVDRMRGQSFALLPLREASAVAVAKDMAQLFVAAGPGFQAIPIPRMNAVLVITSTIEQLQRARGWVARLDRENRDNGRIYVYPVQNRRASEIATVLRRMLGLAGDTGDAGERGADVSPGLRSQTTGSTSAALPSSNLGMTGQGGGAVLAGPSAPGSDNASLSPMGRLEAAFASETDGQNGQSGKRPILIQADVATNSLVVTASAVDWRMISATIARLDVQPTQVLIEATIAEVMLNDELKHGVRWFFETGNHRLGVSDATTSATSSAATGAVGATLAGGTYSFSVPSAALIVNALEQVTDVEIVSSPALTVLDNQTATLKVGDQVPIATRAAQSITTPESPVVNDIEMKDTGVILSVTPRVNAGGLVQLDISQEVSSVVQTTTSAIDSPTIRLRKVDSTVAVASGDEIVLGGLIGSHRERSDGGVPFLKDIPLLGKAFTSNAARTADRSELLIILRPTVMASRSDVAAVTQAIRAGMARTSRAIGP